MSVAAATGMDSVRSSNFELWQDSPDHEVRLKVWISSIPEEREYFTYNASWWIARGER